MIRDPLDALSTDADVRASNTEAPAVGSLLDQLSEAAEADIKSIAARVEVAEHTENEGVHSIADADDSNLVTDAGTTGNNGTNADSLDTESTRYKDALLEFEDDIMTDAREGSKLVGQAIAEGSVLSAEAEVAGEKYGKIALAEGEVLAADAISNAKVLATEAKETADKIEVEAKEAYQKYAPLAKAEAIKTGKALVAAGKKYGPKVQAALAKAAQAMKKETLKLSKRAAPMLAAFGKYVGLAGKAALTKGETMVTQENIDAVTGEIASVEQKLSHQSPVQYKENCVGCRFVWTKVDAVLDSSSGYSDVRNSLESVCASMPNLFVDVVSYLSAAFYHMYFYTI